ncbi:MAG: translation initiation factor IF-2 [Candidatus Daviesbacteria bacterium]|nr:translation initiation factor IF-2 [Candidatus Daviesbacteria bacterium]
METLRAPIVTILGHVDHGKTTLLDFIRKTTVAAKEHGGITQHIGAYQVEYEGKLITFIDTPGHAAFEKMRSRGARVADIAVLVVALDDGIMPQTTEAIKHILGAKVPMIVAVNKIDLPGIDQKIQLERIKKQLSDKEVLVEEYGGDVPIVPLSAKTGEGVDKLLEMIQLVAEMHELKADPTLPASGVVIESSLDKFKGAIATILVRNGSLKKGDEVMLGGIKGKVRGMFDFAGKPVDVAQPSQPVEVLGLGGVPAVGAALGEEAQIAAQKDELLSLVDRLKQTDTKTLKVVVKADKQGSLEAILDALNKFNETNKMVDIALSGVGDISESDIKLAASIKAIVIGFNVKVAPNVNKMAENDHILIRTYNIIYEMLDELEDVVEGMLKQDKIEEVMGRAEIIAEFPYGKDERIAGCRVVEGAIAKGPKVRVTRADEVIAEGKIKSLKKVREEVQRVEKGSDCGIMFDTPIDFQIGDFVESYRVI